MQTLCLVALVAGPVEARQQSHIVLDHDSGEVLQAREADERAYPASLTKMMTLYLTFRALEAGQITMKSRLPVSSRAARMPPTKLGLKAGAKLRVEDAVLGLVTRSANDAAVVLAEALGGSESRFALLMTKTARRLGMSRTVFRNASGLPDRKQVSTARDMARLGRELIDDFPQYYRYFSRESFSLAGRTFENHNRLMLSYGGMDGLKTGYTRASGFNLAASAMRDGRRLVAVVLGGETAQARDKRMAGLLDSGFEEIERRGPLVAMVGPPLPKPDAVAAVLVAAVESDDKAEPASEVVLASLDGAAAATMTDMPVPEPRIALATATARPTLGVRPIAARRLARARAANEAARARTVAKVRAAETASSSRQLFGVQVGAFRQPEAARRAAWRAKRTAPDLLRGTFASVSTLASGRQPLFRATLVGLDAGEADQVCRMLLQHSQDCIVVRTAPLTLAQR